MCQHENRENSENWRFIFMEIFYFVVYDIWLMIGEFIEKWTYEKC